MRITVLHPGEMGVTVAQSLVSSGQDACWVAEGRSEATVARAAGLERLDTQAQAIETSDVLFSVCPPGAAFELADRIAAQGYRGLYVDANAVAPSTAARIGDLFGERFVDGGIIGPPAQTRGSTRLYLSGRRAGDIAALFADCPLQAIAFSEEPGAASALKMAYAAYTKGSSALLLLVNALAKQANVRDMLVEEWSISQPGLADRSESTARGTSRKAWRFVGEMQEIAATFREFGLPGEFHDGAAELYSRMVDLKNVPPSDLDAVLATILEGQP